MLKNLSEIFEKYTEGVVVLHDDVVVWQNAAAKNIFPKEELKIQDILPPELMDLRETKGVSEIMLHEHRFVVSVSELLEYTIISFIKQVSTDEQEDLLIYTSRYIRNALSTLRLSADFIRSHTEAISYPQLKYYMAILYHSYFSILRISDNLAYLTPKKIQSHLEEKLIDIAELCEKITDSINCLTKGEKAQIVCRASRNLWITSNSDELEILLLNLLANSLQYTEKDGTITVTAESRDKKIYITVSDTGTGIAPEQLSQVFSRYAVPREQRDPKEGIGLGLAVVMKIARKYDGNVMLESQQGKGTKVTVILPETEVQNKFGNVVSEYASDNMSGMLTALSEVLSYKSYMSKYLD